MFQQLTNILHSGTPASAQPRLPVDSDEGFVPNFCRGEMVFNVAALAQALAVIATIIVPPITTSVFLDLLLISLLLQWIALLSAGTLCVARPYLNRLSERRALLMAYLLLLCVTWVVGELTLWLLAFSDAISSARPDWYGYFHIQNLTVSAIVNGLALRYFVARHKLRQSTVAAERARAEILRYRIRPHFLFSSMNIIASLTQRAPARAEAAIEDMADLFRLMLDDTKDLAPVHNEIRVARQYVKLEKLRLDKRLNVNWDVEGVPRTAKTPVFMLPLLLENAVHYGIEQLPEGGEIDVSVRLEDDRLHFTVSNPLPERPIDDDRQDTSSALENIRLRLMDLYGDRYEVNVNAEPRHFIIHISHPAFRGEVYEDPRS